MRHAALVGLVVLATAPVRSQVPDTLVVSFASAGGAASVETPGLTSQYMRPVRDGGPAAEPVTGIPASLSPTERFVVSLDWSDEAPPAGFDGDVSVVIGRDVDERHIVLVDTDNDEDFADETPTVLPHYRLGAMRADAGRRLAAARVAYDRLVDGRPVPAQANLTISPYAAKPDGTPAVRANGSTVYESTLGLHRTAHVEVEGMRYVLDLFPGVPRGAFDQKFSLVHVQTSGPTSSDDGVYESHDALRLGDAGFRLHTLARDGSRAVYVRTPGGYPAVGTRVGQTAPAVEAPALDGDRPVRIADYRGKYVLLDFWGTWCAPCRAEAPTLKTAYERYGGDRFEIVGVALDDPATLRAYVEEQGFAWPQAAVGDTPGEWIEAYNLVAYPTAFLLGPDGTILAKGEALRGEALLPTLAAIVGAQL